MINRNTHSIKYPVVLTGLFKSQGELYRAQEVLTDFGYHKDEIDVIEVEAVDEESRHAGQIDEDSSRRSFSLRDDSLRKGRVALTALLLSTALAGLYLIPLPAISLGDLIAVGVVWLAIMIVSVIACASLGYLTANAISSPLSEVEQEEYQNKPNHGEALISVVPRNQIDASDLEREWKEIGGETTLRVPLSTSKSFFLHSSAR